MASSLNGHAPSTNGHHNNGTVKEKHSWQFREQSIPPRVWYLLREEKISAKDLLLISVIGSLTKAQTEEAGQGCYASNKYLAEAIKSHPMHVSKRISHLAKEGILLIVHMNDQRYLEVEWSRTSEEREALEGEYGKQYRRAYRILLKQLEERGVSLNANPPKPQGKLDPPALRLTPPKPQGLPITKDEYEGIERMKGVPPRNGFAGKERAGSPEDVAAAEKLKESLRTSNRRVEGWNSAGWSGTFRLLREKDKQEYGPVLDWFCLNSSREKQDQFKLPSICNAKQFRKHFEWISDVMRKDRKKSGADCPYETFKVGGVVYARVPVAGGFSEIPLDEVDRKLRSQNRTGDWYAD